MKTNYKLNKYLKGNLYLIALCLLTIIGLNSCTKNFEKYNTDQTGIANKDLKVPTLFIPIEQQIFQNYQVSQNLNADAYAGYSCPPQTFGRTLYNMNYVFVDGWNQTAFNQIYTKILGPIKNKLAPIGVKTSLPDFWAIALLLEVEAMDRVTDKFGPAPYSKVGSSLISIPYDDQQSIYQQMFLQLDTASTNLQTYIAANPGKTPFVNSDVIFNGDYTKWLKFANSLRLRLAMHIVKVDPATAQAQAEKALSAAGGLLSDVSDDAAIAGSGQNDYFVITASYTDNSMNASIQSYMVGYNDPRISKYFTPINPTFTFPGASYAGKYIGIRIGSDVPNKPAYSGYSVYNFTNTFTAAAPQLMMTAAEVWFLKAEAALRGWAGAGDIQTDYETGIQTSMTQYGVASGAAGFIADATSTPAAYTDPQNAVNSSPALSAITIKWDPAAGNETKLERIITQKWLAMFPEGQEAWTEFRRTGYPKLFPVVNNNSNGTIDTKIQVRRLPYPLSEYTTNTAGVQGGVKLLNGADNGGTRLWWDVNKPNF
ncbi:SusD/RagB family nutrient-binding outer membrane lipoprotein [Mucilaginibacter sp. OK098]|uniref:SusD/RagB family nutrient-binding outer membrane lipoprotein n=1 Tax=Mucilaginibacter sp. OK098 TaxID=1855297 RepID=UPI00091CE631|nr:SusD/RagB family nutrient-binding outer membrane lipoprotein [Mucilaginibacter sp. OK098]SHN34924.1 Susd and RagB outer membrane lipoprotein [Mucilaginibacter sp. OK098]